VAARKGTKTKKTTKPSSARNTQRKKNSGKNIKVPWAILLWLIFAIFIFGLFLFNREAIDSGLQIVKNAFSSRETAEKWLPEAQSEEPPAIVPSDAAAPAAQQPAKQPPVVQPAEPVKRPDSTTPQPAQPNPQSQTVQSPAPAQRPPELAAESEGRGSPPATRERVLYFIQVDRSGNISRVQANRKFSLSDSPLTDVIKALIAGPNAEEKSKGLISLIPPAAKLLSASIRGNTAYLSFNEDFQYNTYGVEGYAGQLRQIVFTVTEFPNVADVQILIEGRRIDYLGEGVWVGSPVSRDML
jgi:spore germination protein GerM